VPTFPMAAPKSPTGMLWAGAGGLGCLGVLCMFTWILFFPGIFLFIAAVALVIVAAIKVSA
jgi:hypothetical protein